MSDAERWRALAAIARAHPCDRVWLQWLDDEHACAGITRVGRVVDDDTLAHAIEQLVDVERVQRQARAAHIRGEPR